MPAYGITVESTNGAGKLRKVTLELVASADDYDKAAEEAETLAESILNAAGQVTGEPPLELDATY
jgi:dsDNA-binding SOS-regulon protein